MFKWQGELDRWKLLVEILWVFDKLNAKNENYRPRVCNRELEK